MLKRKPPAGALPVLYFASALAVGWQVSQIVLHPEYRWVMVDMQVFRDASGTAFSGGEVYGTAGFTSSSLPFLYPPFALIALWPLYAVPLDLAKAASALASLLALAVICRLSATRVTRTSRAAHLLAVGSFALLVVCEPMLQNLEMGQVNVVIAAVLLVDFLLPRSNRFKGLLTGLMAGIKLTPAFFAVFYLVTGQRRAAANAAASFLGSVLLSFAVFPTLALEYWTQTVFQSRIGPAQLGNQAIAGVLNRIAAESGWDASTGKLAWAVAAVAIAGWALVVFRDVRVGKIAAFSAVSFATLLISPLSWTPHWILAAPAVILAIGSARSRLRAVMTAVVLGGVLFIWPVNGVPSGLLWFAYQADFTAPGSPWWHTVVAWLSSGLYAAIGLVGLSILTVTAKRFRRVPEPSVTLVPQGQ